MAVYKISIEFLFKSLPDFKGEMVDINKRYKQIIWFFKADYPSKKSRKDLNIRGLVDRGLQGMNIEQDRLYKETNP